MGSLCRCLFQYCCHSSRSNDDADDDIDEPENDHPVTRRPSYSSVAEYVHPIEGQGLIVNRGEEQQQRRRNHTITNVGAVESSTTLASTTSTSQSSTILNANDDDDTVAITTCCRPSSSSSDPNHSSLLDMIRRRMNRWSNNSITINRYNAVVATADDALYTHHFSATMKDPKLSAPSPLRQALTFTATNDVNHLCTIPADEFVLPGSMIQHQMAEQMILSTAGKSVVDAIADECVICMEPFDSTNPRMPTLCQCGANKTYFHLPCLYQWIEQSENCPSCRSKITWEEF